jgi:hypothetical protein
MDKCSKCGLPVHQISKGANVWVHDDYRKAWKVDRDGYAQSLHFAEVKG